MHTLTNIHQTYKKDERRKRRARQAFGEAVRKCLGVPPDAPKNTNFSAVHFHPEYARNHPDGMGRKLKLLDPKEAARYGMTTIWNKPSCEYNEEGTPKVLAIPNYFGVIRGDYEYADIRYSRSLKKTAPKCWKRPSLKTLEPTPKRPRLNTLEPAPAPTPTPNAPPTLRGMSQIHSINARYT